MRKQIISLLVAILVFVAMVPAAFAANNQQLAARLEGDSTTSSLVLLDEVCVATDSYGNSYVINGKVGLALAGVALYDRQLPKRDIRKP